MQAASFISASTFHRGPHDVRGKQSRLRQSLVAATGSTVHEQKQNSIPLQQGQQQQQQQPQQQQQRKKMLQGYESFVRKNPKTDRFAVHGFDHIEFWCGDATNTWRRFSWGLGMSLVAKSDQTTGNHSYCSYVLQSQQLRMVFSAPYSASAPPPDTARPPPHPAARRPEMLAFFDAHGLAVRAVGLRVADVDRAFHVSVQHGAAPVLEPRVLRDAPSGTALRIAEVSLYGDVVLRYVGGDYSGVLLPGYEQVAASGPSDGIGLKRLDHAVGNVEDLAQAAEYISGFSGFHQFAEFTAEDVGTADSGLNSLVLASDNEMVLLPINEPVHGTRRKSQIQTYLEHNEGAGLQHLAIVCDDIFHTLREMRMRSEIGGFEFMPKPNRKYYRDLPERIGSALSPEQVQMCEELGILVDKDDQGLLLQIFTKPVGDRPTLFLEIIQRIGCDEDGEEQRGGCGGFGKGNFSALFKSIEDFEKTLDGSA